MRAALVLAIFVAGCPSSPVLAPTVPAKEAVPHNFGAVASPELVASTFNGRIEVSESTDGAVHATVTKHTEGTNQSDAAARLRDIEVDFAAQGSVLRVTARRTSGRKDDAGAADLVVSVPKDSTLTLTTTNGGVEARGVGRAVTARSSNGDINLTGGQGPIDATTSNGRISLRPSGTVTAVVVTSNGAIAFDGALGPGTNRFETSNGAINLTLPKASEFQLDATTSLGEVTCGFQVTPTGAGTAREVHGRVGTDQRTLISAHTSVGGISVQAK